VIDLVVALPFSVMAMSACTGQSRRAIAAGALTLGWLAYLRFGLPLFVLSPLGAWMAVLATLVVSAVLAGAKDLTPRLHFPAGSEVPSPAD